MDTFYSTNQFETGKLEPNWFVELKPDWSIYDLVAYSKQNSSLSLPAQIQPALRSGQICLWYAIKSHSQRIVGTSTPQWGLM